MGRPPKNPDGTKIELNKKIQVRPITHATLTAWREMYGTPFGVIFDALVDFVIKHPGFVMPIVPVNKQVKPKPGAIFLRIGQPVPNETPNATD